MSLEEPPARRSHNACHHSALGLLRHSWSAGSVRGEGSRVGGGRKHGGEMLTCMFLTCWMSWMCRFVRIHPLFIARYYVSEQHVHHMSTTCSWQVPCFTHRRWEKNTLNSNKKANNPVSNSFIIVISLFNFLIFASYISAKFHKGHPDSNNSRHIKL